MVGPLRAHDAGRLAAWRVSHAPWLAHECQRFLGAQHGGLARAWFQQADVWTLPATLPLLTTWVEDTLRALRQSRLSPRAYDACASALRRGAAAGVWQPVAGDPMGGPLLDAVANAPSSTSPWTWRTDRVALWAADRLLRHPATPSMQVLAIGQCLALDGPGQARFTPRHWAATTDRVRRLRTALAHPQAPVALIDHWTAGLGAISPQHPQFSATVAFVLEILLPTLCRLPAIPARLAQGAVVRSWLDRVQVVPLPVAAWWPRVLTAPDFAMATWWLTRTITATPALLATALPQLSVAQRRALSSEGLALCCQTEHPGLREAALTALLPTHRRPRVARVARAPVP